MNKPLIDLRSIAFGLLLGVGVTFAMGQAPAAPQIPARYQITTMRDSNGNLEFIILDHQTSRLYQKRTGSIKDGTTVEQLLKQ
jgi:hypothetical protein